MNLTVNYSEGSRENRSVHMGWLGSLVTMNHADRPSMTIIRTIAELEGVDPLELDFLLCDWIDPEALDNLVRHARESPTATGFDLHCSIAGYSIAVTEGSVHVEREPTGVAQPVGPVGPVQQPSVPSGPIMSTHDQRTEKRFDSD